MSENVKRGLAAGLHCGMVAGLTALVSWASGVETSHLIGWVAAVVACSALSRT